MSYDLAGLGNALMDALVITEDDQLLSDLGLVRGTMHPVDDAGWQVIFNKLGPCEVLYESGGSCANTIATAGRLGANAIYRGQVGRDALGQKYRERMLEATGHDALVESSDVATGKCLSLVSKHDAERTMVTDLGAAVSMPSLGEFRDVVPQSKIVHFTGYTLLDGPMLPVVMEAMAMAKAAGAKISLDVADPFVVQAIRDRTWQVIDEYADIVFLNSEEARALTGQSPEDSVNIVANEARVETVVVKLGSRGSLVRHGDDVHQVAVKPVDAVDTTGAGDAYAGGFLYGMLQGWDAAACGALGSAVAARTVAQLGAVVTDRDALASDVAEVLGNASR